jgi:hypothetical protein
MYEGTMRHYMTYTMQTKLSTLGNCKDYLGNYALLDITNLQSGATPGVKVYQYSDAIVFLPSSTSTYDIVPTQYRFTIDTIQTQFQVIQVYESELNVAVHLQDSEAEIGPGYSLTPYGSWNVPFDLNLTFLVTTIVPEAGVLVGPSSIVAAASPLSPPNIQMPVTGCYDFPYGQLPLAVGPPSCGLYGSITTCVTTLSLFTAAYFPNAQGNEFYATCPNVLNCSSTVFQSSLGLYTFGMMMQSCPTSLGWDQNCTTLNGGNPIIAQTIFTPYVPPLPPSGQLTSTISTSMLPDKNSPPSTAIASYSSGNEPGIVYNDTAMITIGSEIASAVEPYLGLNVVNYTMCFGPLSHVNQVLNNKTLLSSGYTCNQDPAMILSKQIWVNGADAGGYFQTGDVPFKGPSTTAISSLPGCQSEPGCDMSSMRASRVIQIFGSQVDQSPYQQDNGFLLQVTSQIAGLNPVVSSPRVVTQFAQAIPKPRPSAQFVKSRLPKTPVLHDSPPYSATVIVTGSPPSVVIQSTNPSTSSSSSSTTAIIAGSVAGGVIALAALIWFICVQCRTGKWCPCQEMCTGDCCGFKPKYGKLRQSDDKS